MLTPEVNITSEQLFEILRLSLSMDEYKLLRSVLDHQRSIEVLMAGNIKARSYLVCHEYGESHETILRIAASDGMQGRVLFTLLDSNVSPFDELVDEYIGRPHITLEIAAVAHKFGISYARFPRSVKRTATLSAMLERATIYEITDAWVLLEDKNYGRWFRWLVAHGTPPQEAVMLVNA